MYHNSDSLSVLITSLYICEYIELYFIQHRLLILCTLYLLARITIHIATI